MKQISPGLVSVVLVNFRGADDTIEAIRHLDAMEWPADRLEIVVVENGSGDDSADRIAEAAPHVTLVRSAENLGFAGGSNLGVKASAGEIVGFLNNDAKPHPRWVSAAIESFNGSPDIAAVASKVLDWEGKLVDFVDAGLTWYGMGYKPLTGEPVPRSSTTGRKDVLFGTGSAMFVRRSTFEELGGFDERFFMFFEDVDFGWRLNLRGKRFLYNPDSIAYHKHHASMKSLGQFKETYLLERNALYSLYKNASDEVLAEALPAAMALSIRRGVARGELDSTALDIRRGSTDGELESPVAKQTLSSVFAIDQFVEHLAGLRASRDEIQRSRTVSDGRLWALFGETDVAAWNQPAYDEGYLAITAAFDVVEPPVKRRVVIVTGDPVGPNMAGPAIRAWNMATTLARIAEVRLISLNSVEGAFAGVELARVAAGDDRGFSVHEKWADIIIFQGHALDVFATLRSSSKILIADVYDPMHFEQLEQARALPRAEWDLRVSEAAETLNRQLERADFLLCASERQRFLYLGQLSALGRINPANYEDDPDLSGLIAVVPFGMSSTPPVHERPVLRGVVDGIAADDKVVIWSGGLYDWFDPQTLVRAIAELAQSGRPVRLFFQGIKHPHPDVAEMAIVRTTRELAQSLGVLGTSVFINDSWVAYADRGSYLLEADAGVSTHHNHIETTFSFRTRILDYLWAELPIVVTEGDYFAELVAKEGLGIVVPAGDSGALAAALERVLYDAEFAQSARANIARVRERFVWEQALAPLVAFVADPGAAGDRRSGRPRSPSRPRQQRRRPIRLVRDAGRVMHYLRNGGISVVADKVRRRLSRPR